QSDSLSLVNGSASKADLSGATVKVLAQNGTYAASTQYTILTATGGFGGTTFAGVTSNLAFLTPSLTYDTNNNKVILTLPNDGSGGGSGGGGGGGGTGGGGTGGGGTGGGTGGTGNIFATVAQTRNQTAVAMALDPNAAANPLVLAPLNQTADGALQAFDALSGEVFGSVHNTQAGEAQFARGGMLGRMRQMTYAGTPGPF